MNTFGRNLLLFGAALCGTTAGLLGQALTSPKHVIMAHSSGHGGTTATVKYSLVATFGDGAVSAMTSTSKHIIHGGFNTAVDVPTIGAPVLSEVLPRYATLRGKESLTLYGTELNLGPSPTIKIGGQPAILGTRRNDRITTTLPIQPAPGWQPVEISNSLGTTILPKGVGVLPMIEARPAAADGVPFALVFKGTQRDTIFWAIGIGPSTPLPLPGIHYGFALNPAFFLVLPGLGVAATNGELVLPFAATKYVTGSIWIQAVFASSNPGYGPASFSNVLQL